MITTFKQAKDLAAQYNKCVTDLERLRFLQDEPDMKVILDNDLTMVEFIVDDTDEYLHDLVMEIDLNSFENYHGWTDGVVELFRFAGINAETA